MTTLRHTIRLLAIALLAAFALAAATAQTPIGTVITNRATITHSVPGGGFPRTDSSNTSAIAVEGNSLTLAKGVFPAVPVPGDTVTYTIIAGNVNVAPLSGVVVRDTIPASLTAISATRGTLTGNILVWNAGTIAPGAHDTVLVRARLNGMPAAGLVIMNTCVAVDSAGASAVASAALTVGAAPALSFTKLASAEFVAGGDTLVYRLAVSNPGNTTLRAVSFVDTLPAAVTFLSATPSVIVSGGVVSRTIDSLAAGSTDTTTVSVIVGAGLAGNALIANTAHASSDQTTDEAASADATVLGRPAFAFSKSASSDTVAYGDTLRYTLRVTNTGNLTLSNVAIVDTLPAATTFIAATAGTAAGNIFSFTLSSLPMGTTDSVVVSVRMTGLASAPTTLVNRAHASHGSAPTQTGSASVLYRTLPLFSIAKSADTDTLIVGGRVHYTITVANTGDVPLAMFAVRDTVPSQLDSVSASPNAAVSGNVVTFMRDTLKIGERDTVRITARLPLSGVPGAMVTNRAWGSSGQTGSLVSPASLLTALPPVLTSCRLVVSAAPTRIYGDGSDSSIVSVLFTDTSGTPKPDGTPVFLYAPGMTFANGRDTVTRYTVGGAVVEPVKFLWTGTGYTMLPVLVTGTDPAGCSATDSITLTFTPGALIGSVRDLRTNAAVAGALVRLREINTPPVDAALTDAKGRYLIPLPASGPYDVTVVAQDEFLRTVTIGTSILADLSGASPVTPIPDRNAVSGRLYVGPTHAPLAVAGVAMVLADSATGAAIDIVTTDTTGAYVFTAFVPGAYRVIVGDPRYAGSYGFRNDGGGEHLLNANIAVQPGSSLVFTKNAPSRVYAGDTLRYQIAFNNRNAMALHNATVVDTLDARVRFVGATGPYTYDAASRRISWPLAGADTGAAYAFTVTVIAGDSARSSFTLVNTAHLDGDEIDPVSASATTDVALEARLSIWKTVSDAEAAAGDTLTYEIYVENPSSAHADSVVVRDVLPAELEFLSANPQATILSDGTLVWTTDSLKPAENRKFTIVVRVRTDLSYGDHEFTNEAHLQWFGGQGTSSLDARSHATTSLLVPYLQVTKQAVRRIVEVGDLALYQVAVTNLSATSPAYDVRIVDSPPLGFRYVVGSSFRDSTRIADPVIERDMTWDLTDSLAPGATVRLTYRLAVGAGALDGTGVNSAVARGLSSLGDPMASNVAADRVEVRAGVFSERGLVVGKVFYDDNENVWQDPGEDGLKGIELLMEDGTRVTTGDDGKFSLPDVAPGEHVLRLREATLPPGDELLLGHADFANVASSRFVRVPESGIARADFYVRRAPQAATALAQTVAVYGRLSVQRFADPKDLVFVKDERIAPISIKGTLFEVGKANLKKEALPTLRAVADYAREYPDQLLAISGHTDASPIHTKEFPSNQELSEARAEAVKEFLVTDEGIYPDRITTTGFGPSQPVATNATKDGRSLNRRVEIMMTTEGRLFENYYRTVRMRVAVSYHGPAAISGLEIRDRLDTAFHYVPGSARVGATPVTPTKEGDVLVWTIPDLGTSYDGALFYDVRVYAPKAGSRAARSSSTVRYTIDARSSTLDASCWTTNVIARTVKNTPVRLVVPGAFVDAETAELSVEALNELQGAANILHAFPNATALIEGHTGARDPEAKGFSSNVALSRARAQAVLHALATKFGIDSSRLHATGWGELKPAGSKKADNRIEILIDKPETGSEVYDERKADSSEVVGRTIGKPVASLTAAAGDRVVLTMTASSGSSGDVTAIAATDTLPPGLVPEEGSLRAVRGVDSVALDGNVIRMRWTPGDSIHVYEFTTTLPGAGTIARSVGVVRTVRGRSVYETPPPVKLRVEAVNGRTRP